MSGELRSGNEAPEGRFMQTNGALVDIFAYWREAMPGCRKNLAFRRPNAIAYASVIRTGRAVVFFI
jgi:hypothetical protein